MWRSQRHKIGAGAPPRHELRLRECVCSSLDIEIWDEAWLLREIKLRYGIVIDSLVEANITALHRSILQANWNRVFNSEYYEVLASALFTRFRSRHDHTFAEKVLSAMRKGFGGHVEPKASSPKAPSA